MPYGLGGRDVHVPAVLPRTGSLRGHGGTGHEPGQGPAGGGHGTGVDVPGTALIGGRPAPESTTALDTSGVRCLRRGGDGPGDGGCGRRGEVGGGAYGSVEHCRHGGAVSRGGRG